MTKDELDQCLLQYSLDDLDIEIWKTISLPDSKYNYQISNYGRFRNKTTGKIIKPYFTFKKTFDDYITINRYRAVMHTLDRHKTLKPLISRLVALHFVFNPNPSVFTEVDHLDGNRLNDHYTNLEWVSPEINKQRAFDMKLRKPRFGSKNASSIWFRA